VEVGFSFIFLLAEGAIVDLHVELRRANVKIESHEEALVDVVVFCELRPATPKRKEKIWGGAAGAAEVEGGGATGPGAAPVTLGLFLLPGGRPGRRFAEAADVDPAAARVLVFLFLLPRGRPRPRGATGEPRFRRESSAAAMRTKEERKTLDGGRR
jgi:hypothetical protein